MVFLCGLGVLLFTFFLLIIFRMGFRVDVNGVYSKLIKTVEYDGFIPWRDISDVRCLSDNPRFPFIRFQLRRGKSYTGVGFFKNITKNNKACFDVSTKLYWKKPSEIVNDIKLARRVSS